MIFENITNGNQPETKKISKHIKFNPNELINLNAIQLAYKTETNQHITLNDLVSISINLFINEIKKEIVRNNEIKAIEYIKTLKKEIK